MKAQDACIAVAFAAIALPTQATATELEARVSGFGTLGVVHSSERNADFTAVGDQPGGAGFTRSADFKADSKFAVQTDVKYGDQISATGQLMLRERYDGSFKPDVMIAFLKWRPTNSLEVRLGRYLYPTFLISDSRDVGYSQTTLRPPVDLYNPFFLHYLDGGLVSWTTGVGSVALKSQAFIGRNKFELPNGGHLDSSPQWGLNTTADVGDLTVRLSYLHAKATITSDGLDPVFAGVRFGFPAGALGPGSPAIPGSPELADKFYGPDTTVRYMSAGLSYDPGPWLFTAEIATVNQIVFLPKRSFGYMTLGARLGKFTPYTTLSRVSYRTQEPTANPVLDQVLGSIAPVSQSTVSMGVRWDAAKDVDVKVQFDRVKPGSGSHGQLTNLQPAYEPGKRYGLISASVDFVF